MIKQSVRLVVSSAVVVAALTSASTASAHPETWVSAPRALLQNDELDFTADQVATHVTTTESSATVTTTLLTDANYLYAIDLALNCDDGNLVTNEIVPMFENGGDSRSCESGAKIVDAYVIIRLYGVGPDHEEGEEGGEEEGGEEEEVEEG